MLPQRNRWDVGPRPNSELTRARFQKNLKNQKKLRREGIKRRAVYLRKEWRDLVMFSITCEERGAPWRGQTQARPR